MRYALLFAAPALLAIVSTTSAQQLVPINAPYESTRSVVYAPAVEVETIETSVTTLEPVAADYASTAPSLSQPYYTSSPASAGCAACGSSPCACAPCACAPAGYAPCASCGAATTYQPVVTPYRLGHGIIGQPKLYVDGQPIRNTLRFFTP